MKIGNVTLYLHDNFGCFMQGYCLRNFIRNQGHEVYLVKLDNDAKPKGYVRKIKSFVLNLIRNVIYNKFNVRNYINQIKYNKEKKKHKIDYEFEFIKPTEKTDMIVIGSDELWNIKNKSFTNLLQFWGFGLNTKRAITYGVSVGTSDYKDLKNCKINLDCLFDFGVRDLNTSEFVEKDIDRKPTKVLDPTLLFNRDYFKNIQRKLKEDIKDYILIYTYKSIRKNYELIRNAKELAKEKNLKLVSIGNYLPWCDISIPANPFECLWLFDNAEFVMTDTFHGTIFSVIYGKQFKSFPASPKTLDFLNMINVRNHILNYSEVYNILKKKKEESINFLRRNIK